MTNKFTTYEWIGLLVSVLCMGVGVTAWAYSQFPIKADLERRLDRIEEKLDRQAEMLQSIRHGQRK